LRVLAEGVQAAVDEDADVSFVPIHNAADLDVTEPFGPQVDRFPLARRQSLDEQAQAGMQFGLFGRVGGVDLAARDVTVDDLADEVRPGL